MQLSLRYAVLLGLLLSSSLFAHQQQESNTLVRFNARSGAVEIAHRFYAHDAEHAVKRIVGKQADLLGSAETRTQFSRYVASRFGLKSQNGELVKPLMLGEEIDGKFIWVYQEVPNSQLDTISHVKADFFYDIWPRYKNVVDVEYGKALKSLRMGKSDTWNPLPSP